MIVPLIPIYGKQMGATGGELGLLMAGLFAGRLLAQLPAGIATDRIGRRPVLLFATLGYAITCVGYASATAPTFLILFRLLQGVSAGFFSVAARSLVSDLGGPRLRGTAQGVYSSSVNLGFVIGPIAAGTIAAANINITVPFWASAVLSLVAFVALAFITYPTRRQSSTREPKARSSRPNPSKRNMRIGLLALANLSFMAGLAVIMALFPIAGQEEIKGGIAFVGPAYAIAGISGLLLGPFAGKISDRVGRTPVMIIGTCLAAAEGASLLLTRSPWIIGVGFFLGGIGVAAFFNSLHAALGDLTVRAKRGKVTGIVGLAGESGGIVGSLLAPLVWNITDLKIPFGLQLVFATVTVILIVALGKQIPPHKAGRAVVRETLIPG
jgi:MFS family permease